MCRTTLAIPVIGDLTAHWVPPSSRNWAGKCVISAGCGCAAVALNRSLPLTTETGLRIATAFQVHGRWCAQHEAAPIVMPIQLNPSSPMSTREAASLLSIPEATVRNTLLTLFSTTD